MLLIERLITLIGAEISPNICYRFVEPKCKNLAKILAEKRQIQLSRHALPFLLLTIVMMAPQAFYMYFDTSYG